jgi:hypothetical protein
MDPEKLAALYAAGGGDGGDSGDDSDGQGGNPPTGDSDDGRQYNR